ncbi:hypothetical protein D3C72_1230190 [compost metagenome]
MSGEGAKCEGFLLHGHQVRTDQRIGAGQVQNARGGGSVRLRQVGRPVKTHDVQALCGQRVAQQRIAVPGAPHEEAIRDQACIGFQGGQVKAGIGDALRGNDAALYAPELSAGLVYRQRQRTAQVGKGFHGEDAADALACHEALCDRGMQRTRGQQ